MGRPDHANKAAHYIISFGASFVLVAAISIAFGMLARYSAPPVAWDANVLHGAVSHALWSMAKPASIVALIVSGLCILLFAISCLWGLFGTASTFAARVLGIVGLAALAAGLYYAKAQL
jgi:hypothetical protein